MQLKIYFQKIFGDYTYTYISLVDIFFLYKKRLVTRELSTRRCSHFEIDTAIVPSQPLRNPIPRKGLAIRVGLPFPSKKRD